jgi:hypothetical protein
VTTQPQPRPKKDANLDPVAKLLKEKEENEKKAATLKLTTLALSSGAENDWTNEQAALKAVSLAPDPNYDLDLDVDEDGNMKGTEEGLLDEDARAKLLGSKRGKVVGDILVKDKEGKEKERNGMVEKGAGVELWIDRHVDGSVDILEVPLEVTNGCRVLEFLKCAIQRGGAYPLPSAPFVSFAD